MWLCLFYFFRMLFIYIFFYIFRVSIRGKEKFLGVKWFFYGKFKILFVLFVLMVFFFFIWYVGMWVEWDVFIEN